MTGKQRPNEGLHAKVPLQTHSSGLGGGSCPPTHLPEAVGTAVAEKGVQRAVSRPRSSHQSPSSAWRK